MCAQYTLLEAARMATTVLQKFNPTEKRISVDSPHKNWRLAQFQSAPLVYGYIVQREVNKTLRDYRVHSLNIHRPCPASCVESEHDVPNTFCFQITSSSFRW
jgi:hypothetical protein